MPNNGEKILLKQRTRNGAMMQNSAEPWNIAVQRPSLNIRKYSFTGQTPGAWNKLPSELKFMDSMPKFKNAMKLYLSTEATGGRPDVS